MKPVEQAVQMHKMIIHQNMMILKNKRKIRFYTTKKTLLMDELMEVMQSVSDHEDDGIMAELSKLSIAMNLMEDEILKLITVNDTVVEYLK
jgi:hypothetical protein